MNNILHASFASAEDGIQAVEALLHAGMRAEDISLILPLPQSGGTEPTLAPQEAVSNKPALPRDDCRETVIDAEEGTGLGLILGLLTALCVPGIGLIAGSGVIVADLMAGGTLAGSIAAGIYGYLIDRGVAHGIAQIMSCHLEAGGTTLSVTVPDARQKGEIASRLKAFGGHIIH